MLYLANASSTNVREAMQAGRLGQMVTPREGRKPLPRVPYGADNGRFGNGYPGDKQWFAWLDTLPREHCLFAVTPDVIANAEATIALSVPMMPRVRQMGFPVAFVAQDGLEHLPTPWDAFDVLFIGGSTQWKLSGMASTLAKEALRLGKRVHMGRVNSYQRLKYAHTIGCSTTDGTFLSFGPDVNLPRVYQWFDKLQRS